VIFKGVVYFSLPKIAKFIKFAKSAILAIVEKSAELLCPCVIINKFVKFAKSGSKK